MIEYIDAKNQSLKLCAVDGVDIVSIFNYFSKTVFFNAVDLSKIEFLPEALLIGIILYSFCTAECCTCKCYNYVSAVHLINSHSAY